ncbi:MAG: hypothetical protein FJY97_15560 [candidate division Zixibacteria bacterium]|nr:hypothetical protein [candidate division Zixibacteria bacterium]
MAVIDEIQRQQAYHTQMGRGSLLIDNNFDLSTFDLDFHFERAGKEVPETVIKVLTEVLKEWAQAYKAGKQTLDYTPEQKAMLGRFNLEFRTNYFGKEFAETFKDQIQVQQLFDATQEHTFSAYGVKVLLITLFVRDPKIVAGDFPSAGHKYAYMAAIRTGLYEIFEGHLIPSLWCIHVSK